MIRPIAVQPRAGYRTWLRYSDGACGEIDLAHLRGRGVFRAWNDRAFFKTVHLSEGGAMAWGDDIELCPDALYTRLTRRSVAGVMPRARPLATDAAGLRAAWDRPKRLEPPGKIPPQD